MQRRAAAWSQNEVIRIIEESEIILDPFGATFLVALMAIPISRAEISCQWAPFQ